MEEAAVGRDDTRSPAEDVLVSLHGGHEERMVGAVDDADVGDDPAFGLLHLHHPPELGRLPGFAAAEDLRLRLEDADDLFGGLAFPLNTRSFRLLHDLRPSGRALEIRTFRCARPDSRPSPPRPLHRFLRLAGSSAA